MPRPGWVRINNVYEQINEFCSKRDSFMELMESMEERVIGQPNLKLAVTNVYIYLQSFWKGLDQNNNMIITAPSGTGKTETYRALKDYFRDVIPDLPIFLIDATQLTPSGYKGSNLDELLTPLFEMGDPEPPAIIFIDEIDKRIMPSGGSNDFGINIQHNLLTILEGGNITETGKRGECSRTISTSKVLFIGLGSFDEYRRVKTDKRGIGFTCEETKDTYLTLTPEIMLDAGATPELMGRFPFVVNYNRLSEANLTKIIKKNIEYLSIVYDCDILIKKAFEKKLLALADSKFGCRAIKNTIQNAVLEAYAPAMIKRRNNDDVLEIVVDETPTFTWREYTEEEASVLLNLFREEMAEEEKKAQELAKQKAFDEGIEMIREMHKAGNRK